MPPGNSNNNNNNKGRNNNSTASGGGNNNNNSGEDLENQELDFGTAEPLRGDIDQSNSVRPSNASTFSSETTSTSSSAASSYQSSLFSNRDASTMNTFTTIDSASTRHSKVNAGTAASGSAAGGASPAAAESNASSNEQGDGNTNTNSGNAIASGKPMTVVDLEDIPQLSESEEHAAFNQNQQHNHHSHHPRYGTATYAYGTTPDVSTDLFSAATLMSPSAAMLRGSSASNSPRQSISSSSAMPPHYQSPPLTVNEELKRMSDELSTILSETSSGEITPSKGSNSINQTLKTCCQAPVMNTVNTGDVSLENEPSLRKSLKIVLHFVDNLLRSQQYQSTRMYLLRSLYELGVKLKLVSSTHGTVPYPKNYSIGTAPEQPSQGLLQELMDSISNSDDPMIAEQEGAFIAPILRGLSPDFSVLSLNFGFPNPDVDHYNMVSTLYDFSPDIHIFCQKNYIRACSGKFKAPFRTPTDSSAPPMALSLATEDAVHLSGTLGGYVYPKINPSHNLYSLYGKSTFALTCAHTCLTESGGIGQPLVCTPSPILISLYRKALVQERDKYPPNTEERNGYQEAIQEIDVQYPISKETHQNQPKDRLGVVAWAERQVVNGSLSDIAIIKCNDGLKCRNFLGDDVYFSEYDPALMFGNMHVKRIVSKLTPGMNVFKYGSTTKYTRGCINGLRIVYWASGRLQSSDFAVASDSMFASGGDSGAWILQKSEDAEIPPMSSSDDSTVRSVSDRDSTTTTGSSNGHCLGAVGMLHSYDGERREFGLFSPIDAILERLRQVTRIKWGVVGVPDDDSDEVLAGGSESSENSEGSSSDGER